MAIFNSYVSLPEGRLISEASGHVWVTPELGADGGASGIHFLQILRSIEARRDRTEPCVIFLASFL